MSHVEDVAPDRLRPAAAGLLWRHVVTRIEILAPALPPRYLRNLGIVLVLYVAVYGLLLGVTRGVPYVTDGNESYSMLTHASNMYHFPLSQTFGLADEALSREPAAHPYVYTHQGNFPRLFTYVLYVLGARSVESQIAITTFTVGLLSAFVIYHYFSTISSVGFALVAASVLLTDYLLFAQWQVNTYRVWHGLFFFLSLLCVHAMEGNRRRAWLVLTFVNYACLFYFELVFGAYVAIMAALYAGIRLWKRPRLLMPYWGLQCAGAFTAVLVLATQLIGYLGWADFLQDVRLTYTARNLIAVDPSYADRIRDFVDSRHIVFWYNFATVEYQRSAAEILSSITRGYFSIYTPTLWYLVMIVTVGWFTAVCSSRRTASPDTPDEASRSHERAWPTILPALLLVIAWSRFVLAVVQRDALNGVAGPRLLADVDDRFLPAVVVVALAAAGAVAASRAATGHWLGLQRLRAVRVVLAALMLLLAEHVVLNSHTLFDPYFLPLWSHIQGNWFAGWMVQLAVIAAAGLAAVVVVAPRVIGETRWPALASYLVCGLLAYAIIYALTPGYLQSGYLQRSVPFASYVLETVIALTIYLGWSAGRGIVRHIREPRLLVEAPMAARTGAKSLAWLATAACVVALLFPAFYWVNLQVVHSRLLPPTHFTFMKQLANAPYKGASFAVNTYAAPIYAYTGEWAYFDTRLALPDGGAVSLTESGGYKVNADGRTYLWLADRDSNDAYERPEYFLCFSYQDLPTAGRRLRGTDVGCSSAGVVRDAIERGQPTVAGHLVAQDSTGRDSWAIVKLDWSILDRPPGKQLAGGTR